MINSAEAKFAAMTDDELFAIKDVWEGSWEIFKAEKAKRQRLIEERQQREETERATKLQSHKEAVTYSDKLAEEICVRISTGELLICICLDEHMPTLRNCYMWLKSHSDFQMIYDESVRDRLKIFEEEVIRIADDMTHDFKTIIKKGKPIKVADPDMVARAKLRIEVRFRHLRAYKPERWGEQTTLNVKNSDPDDPSNLSLDELEAKIADIELKNRIVRSAA